MILMMIVSCPGIYSCSCARTAYDIEFLNSVPIVIKAKVLQKDSEYGPSKRKATIGSKEIPLRSIGETVYTSSVLEVYKGDVMDKEVSIHSGSFICGSRLSVGREYILHLYIDKGKYGTDICMQNALVTKLSSERIKQLKLLKYEGMKKYYGPSGKLIAVGRIRNGNPVGKWRYFSANGKVGSKGRYLNGRRHGKWFFFSMIRENDEARSKYRKLRRVQYDFGEICRQNYYE